MEMLLSDHISSSSLMCVNVLSSPGKENQSPSNGQGEGSQVNGLQTEELTQLREEVEELRKQQTLLQTQLGDSDTLINSLVSKSLCIHVSVCVFWTFKLKRNWWFKITVCWRSSLRTILRLYLEFSSVPVKMLYRVFSTCRSRRQHRQRRPQQQHQKTQNYSRWDSSSLYTLTQFDWTTLC